MLHYFALSDDDYRKCPICYDNINKNDLKSVVSLLHSDFNTGNEIEMVLMRRERESLFAVPVDKYNPDIEGKHPVMSQNWTSYSKIVTASPSEVTNIIIARESKELQEQFIEEKDEPEACFIEEAQGLLQNRQESVLSDCSNDEAMNMESLKAVLEAAPEIEVEDEKEVLTFESSDADLSVLEELGRRPRHASSSSEGGSSVEIDDNCEISAEDLDISNIQKENKSGVRKDTFYFYQSSDGQAIFLHALNVQMLVEEYGSFENCPRVIRGKILEKDNTSMSEDLRDKLRYLRHLPVTCAFEVCELQLNQSLLSKETVAKFMDQLDVRRRRRARRMRDEKRREKRIEVETNKLMGKYPGAKLRIESNFHFPDFGAAERSSSSASNNNNNLRSTESLSSTSPMPEASEVFSTSQDNSSSVPSFANMLRQGASKPSTFNNKEKRDCSDFLWRFS